MKQRNPLAVFFLSLLTLGIYSLVWHVKTKNEMNRLGTTIPTAWLLIIPLVNWYWLWKYCQGVEQVTGGKMSGVLAFVLLFLLGIIGMAILQSEFNKVAGQPIAAGPSNFNPAAAAPIVPLPPAGVSPLPDSSFGGPTFSPNPTNPAVIQPPLPPAVPTANPLPPSPVLPQSPPTPPNVVAPTVPPAPQPVDPNQPLPPTAA